MEPSEDEVGDFIANDCNKWRNKHLTLKARIFVFGFFVINALIIYHERIKMVNHLPVI